MTLTSNLHGKEKYRASIETRLAVLKRKIAALKTDEAAATNPIRIARLAIEIRAIEIEAGYLFLALQ